MAEDGEEEDEWCRSGRRDRRRGKDHNIDVEDRGEMTVNSQRSEVLREGLLLEEVRREGLCSLPSVVALNDDSDRGSHSPPKVRARAPLGRKGALETDASQAYSTSTFPWLKF